MEEYLIKKLEDYLLRWLTLEVRSEKYGQKLPREIFLAVELRDILIDKIAKG